MRLFVAVPVPPDVAAACAAVLPALPQVRPVAPGLMHVTLAFLGSVPAERLDSAAEALAEAARGGAPFRAGLDRIGRFPERGAARVVWIALGPGAAELGALAEATRGALRSRGLAFDDKAFQPHLTLARVRDGAARDDVRALEAALERARVPNATFGIDRIVLFESVVTSKGPRYTARATAHCGGRTG